MLNDYQSIKYVNNFNAKVKENIENNKIFNRKSEFYGADMKNENVFIEYVDLSGEINGNSRCL